jgi:hypothetical protein
LRWKRADDWSRANGYGNCENRGQKRQLAA